MQGDDEADTARSADAPERRRITSKKTSRILFFVGTQSANYTCPNVGRISPGLITGSTALSTRRDTGIFIPDRSAAAAEERLRGAGLESRSTCAVSDSAADFVAPATDEPRAVVNSRGARPAAAVAAVVVEGETRRKFHFFYFVLGFLGAVGVSNSVVSG